MAVITANTGSNNWNTNGCWVGSVQPTAADDVVIPASATVTIPTATTVLGRSLTVAASATLAWASTTAVLTLGDATAGLASVAISIDASATITLTGIGTINLISTNSTVQTITCGTKTLPSITVNGAGSKYQFADALTSSGNLTYTAGAQLDFSTFTHSVSTFTITSNANTREIVLGSTGIVNCTLFGGTAFTASGATNVTITGTAGAQINASNGNSPGINLGTTNYGNVAFAHTSGSQITSTVTSSGATVYSYTRAGSASKIESILFAGTGLTVTNGFLMSGQSTTNRIYMQATVQGTPFTLTNNGTYTISNIDFQDITFAGSASTNFASITGNSGDAGGNSGATFTTTAAQQYDGTAGNWSTAARWTSRVPLPQDDVTFASSSAALTVDMPRLCRDLNYTNYTGTATYSTSLTQTVYGSFTATSGMTFAMGNTVQLTFGGRGTHTFTSAGKTFNFTNGGVIFQGPGGTYTLQDAFATGNGLTVNNGTFDTGGFNVTFSTFTSSNALARTLNWNSSAVSMTATSAATLIQCSTFTNLTNNGLNATFTVTNTSGSTRTLQLGTLSWGTITYTVAGSTGQLTLAGIAYLTAINFSDVTNARTLALTVNSQYTVKTWNVNGTSGKNMSVNSTAGGTPTYLEILGAPQTSAYLTVQDIFSVLPDKLYCTNSTDTSGNKGIDFSTIVTGPSIYRHGENAASSASLTATLSYSQTATANELLFATYCANANPGTVTTPSGYTLIDTQTQGTTAYSYTFRKIAAGGETAVTVATQNTVNGTVQLLDVGGFTGTATVDVSDKNSTAGAANLATNGSNPSNTANPAIALAVWGAANTMGSTISLSNSFNEIRNSAQQTNARFASKLLTSNAAVNTTFTWTSSRAAVAQLVVFKDVVTSSTGNFFAFF